MTRTDFNGLTEAQAEALAHLAEECSEVVMAVCKILRHGLDRENPYQHSLGTNREQLSRELGDLEAAVDIATRYHCVKRPLIAEARRDKLKNVGKFLHHASTKGLRGVDGHQETKR